VTLHLLVHRNTVRIAYRKLLLWFFSILLPVGILSVSNDLFHFGTLLHGSDFPFSQFFFLAVNVFVVVLCTKMLLRTDPTSKGSGLSQDFGYSERERDILPLILEGLSNEEIGERLFISPHTVKNHVTSIFRKAGVLNRFELLKRTTSPS